MVKAWYFFQSSLATFFFRMTMVRSDDDLFAIEAVGLVKGGEVGFDVDGIGNVGAVALGQHDGRGGGEGAGRAELDVFVGLLRIVIEEGEVGGGKRGTMLSIFQSP